MQRRDASVRSCEGGGDRVTELSPNVPSTSTRTPESERAPRVFISYAHDSDAHREQVRDLWIFLCANGVDARIDRVAAAQRQDWPLWMEQRVGEVDRILIVSSPAYRQRAGYEADPGVGWGVQWEARLIGGARLLLGRGWGHFGSGRRLDAPGRGTGAGDARHRHRHLRHREDMTPTLGPRCDLRA